MRFVVSIFMKRVCAAYFDFKHIFLCSPYQTIFFEVCLSILRIQWSGQWLYNYGGDSSSVKVDAVANM